MKCIKCNTDNNRKDRYNNDGKCKKCEYQFVFEPGQLYSQVGFRFTDRFFANKIDLISAENTLYFTEKQFLYYVDRSFQAKFSSSGCWGFLIIIFLVPILGFLVTAILDVAENKLSAVITSAFFIILIVSLLYILFSPTLTGQETKNLIIAPNRFKEWLKKWREVNGEIEKLLPTPKLEKNSNKINKDVIKYSFDRIIVCEKDEIAQFLIANNFHFENNCAIVSINGYPQNIFETVMEMVKRNPNLKIYTLHDASSNGIKILNTLKTKSDWFADNNAVIYDIGLLPRQIFKTKNLSIQQSDNSAILAKNISNIIKDNLSAREIKFLNSGRFLELESFTPQKLIQIVTSTIAKNKVSQTTDNSSEIYLDSNISYEITVELDTFG